MSENIVINIASDFSPTPGPRHQSEGDYSGDLFLEKLLRPKYKAARKTSSKLLINFDGAEGYATSFLESAFGGLAREEDFNEILSTLVFISEEEPYLVDEVKEYIRQARAK